MDGTAGLGGPVEVGRLARGRRDMELGSRLEHAREVAGDGGRLREMSRDGGSWGELAEAHAAMRREASRPRNGGGGGGGGGGGAAAADSSLTRKASRTLTLTLTLTPTLTLTLALTLSLTRRAARRGWARRAARPCASPPSSRASRCDLATPRGREQARPAEADSFISTSAALSLLL